MYEKTRMARSIQPSQYLMKILNQIQSCDCISVEPIILSAILIEKLETESISTKTFPYINATLRTINNNNQKLHTKIHFTFVRPLMPRKRRQMIRIERKLILFLFFL